MINTHIITDPIITNQAQHYLFLLYDTFNQDTPQELHDFSNHYYPELLTFLSQESFTGKAGQKAMIPFFSKTTKTHGHAIFVGLGTPEQQQEYFYEQYRRSVAIGIRAAQSHKITSLATTLIHHPTIDPAYLLEQLVIITNMTNYHFDEFITNPERKCTPINTITIQINTKIIAEHTAQEIVKKASIIAASINHARHWVDLPPTTLTPTYLAEQANQIAQKQGLAITIFNEQQAIDMGMGGLAGVSRGSDEECRLIIMEYKTATPHAPTIAFVGKGITFDSGGLSIKPANSMEDMKEDMSGAAAVIATMEIIAQLKPAINVIGIAPTSENLPSGKATKPGDILRFYNGKTAEVKNTDAEGRLILADALSYAVKHYKPDAIIDIATLTGACSYALGPYNTGLMSRNDALVNRIQEAAITSGDAVWRLPMSDDYQAAIKSSVADICNIGSKDIMAGATTAAHFLEAFVDKTPWAHLDIAGTAFNVPHIPYYRPGATGVGVRLLTTIAMTWKPLTE